LPGSPARISTHRDERMSSPHELQKPVKEFADRLRQRRIRVAVVGDMILDNAIEGVPGGKHAEIEVPLLQDVTFQESIGGPADIAAVILVDHGLGSIGPESTTLIGQAGERQAKLVAIPRTTALRGQPLHAIVINSPEIRGMFAAEAGADPRSLSVRYAREYA